MEQENTFQPTYKVLPPTEKSKERSLLQSNEEKISEAIKLKENGNLDFKSGNYPSALRSYHRVLILLHEYTNKMDIPMLGDPNQFLKRNEQEKIVLSEENKKIIENLHHSTLLNMSQIYLFQKKFEKTIDSVNKAIKIKESDKGRCRRAKAYIEINEFDRAKEDLRIFEELTGDKCEDLLKIIREKEKIEDKKLANGMKKLFC